VSDLEREPRRGEEILADRATQPLDPLAAVALETALVVEPELDAGALDRAAAALHSALVHVVREPMPAALAARVAARGREIVGGTARASAPEASLPPAPAATPTTAPAPSDRSDFVSSLGWLVAAAALVLAVAGFWPRIREALDPPTPAGEMRLFEARAVDRLSGTFAAQAELAGRDVAGRCAWSDSEQRGFLALRGLPPNDATQEQYQLWILVPSQEHPIDGGVFDVKGVAAADATAVPAGGELVVPVAAKLRVLGPTAFAITIEKPGGVVVSDRKRLVLLATLSR